MKKKALNGAEKKRLSSSALNVVYMFFISFVSSHFLREYIYIRRQKVNDKCTVHDMSVKNPFKFKYTLKDLSPPYAFFEPRSKFMMVTLGTEGE